MRCLFFSAKKTGAVIHLSNSLSSPSDFLRGWIEKRIVAEIGNGTVYDVVRETTTAHATENLIIT